MNGIRKRKRSGVHVPGETPSNKTAANAAVTGGDPYPGHLRPTAEECRVVRDELLSLHGFPPAFVKYRNERLASLSAVDRGIPVDPDGSLRSEPSVAGEEEEAEKESVLDGLMKIVLSQNTTETNSLRAFASLKAAFPTWEDVLASEPKSLENAIRCGGLAPKKAACIKNVLNRLADKRGTLCLEYLRDLCLEDIKTELSHFKGIGPKTVSCVLMFNLQQNDFPVDTHVFEIAKAIGWVPCSADRNKTYLHLNRRIPDELKFDLNCLLYTHGKQCRKCIKKVANSKGKVASCDECPLLNYSGNSCSVTSNVVKE